MNQTKTHGQSRTRLYHIWQEIRQRCNNVNCPSFRQYGGRGIKVCRAWSQFPAFYQWAMTHNYAPNLTLDRRNNAKGYCPSNCRWATRSQQQQNKPARSGHKFAGVRFDRSNNRWLVQIAVGGTVRFRASSPDMVSAAWMREFAIKQLHGEFGYFNNPPERRLRVHCSQPEKRLELWKDNLK